MLYVVLLELVLHNTSIWHNHVLQSCTLFTNMILLLPTLLMPLLVLTESMVRLGSSSTSNQEENRKTLYDASPLSSAFGSEKLSPNDNQHGLCFRKYPIVIVQLFLTCRPPLSAFRKSLFRLRLMNKSLEIGTSKKF